MTAETLCTLHASAAISHPAVPVSHIISSQLFLSQLHLLAGRESSWTSDESAAEDILAGLPSVQLSAQLNTVCFAILSETLRMKNLLGNQEVDFNGHIFMTAAF